MNQPDTGSRGGHDVSEYNFVLRVVTLVQGECELANDDIHTKTGKEVNEHISKLKEKWLEFSEVIVCRKTQHADRPAKRS